MPTDFSIAQTLVVVSFHVPDAAESVTSTPGPVPSAPNRTVATPHGALRP